MVHTAIVTITDDLDALVSEINQASWDQANEMSAYDARSLAAFLARQDTIFLACYDDAGPHRTLLGIASGRIELKPYGGERWLYVDEVDTCRDQRRKGAGRAMMERFFAIAAETDCGEVWLGALANNDAANALYRSLGPDDVAQVVGYTYEVED